MQPEVGNLVKMIPDAQAIVLGIANKIGVLICSFVDHDSAKKVWSIYISGIKSPYRDSGLWYLAENDFVVIQ